MSSNLYILIFWTSLIQTLPATYSENNYTQNNGPNSDLFLTPYIESGRIAEAQQLATVTPFLKNIESFAGYLTVNKSTNSNLFFWLFKSQQGNWKKRPLVVWLQGGYIQTSLYGLFRDVGPLLVNKDRKLKRRKYSWDRKCNLVFIDNPIGAGFSFTDNDSGYSKNTSEVANYLYDAIIQLHKLFPTFKVNKLVISGESYGTKYAVAIAHKIYKMNQVADFKLNLERLMLASSVLDPSYSLRYSSYLYNLGVIDETHQRKVFQQEEEFRGDIQAGDFDAAKKAFGVEEKVIKEVTGFVSLLDFVHDDIGLDLKAGAAWFLNQTETKTALHVGNHQLDDNKEAIAHMMGDFMRSVTPLLEELLKAEMFPIMFLNGQLDISAAYVLGEEFLNSLEWPHAKDYYTAKRCQFRVGKQVAGYYKTAGTMTEVLVRNTGHLIAASKPKWTFEIVDRFITDSAGFKCV